MSVRAYRVISKQLANTSFNMWHDDEIVNFIERESGFMDRRNYDGLGFIDVPIATLKELLHKFKWSEKDYRRDAILADIKWAEERQEEYVQYECF